MKRKQPKMKMMKVKAMWEGQGHLERNKTKIVSKSNNRELKELDIFCADEQVILILNVLLFKCAS